MKGLLHIPSPKQLLKVYNQLLTQNPDEQQLCLWAQWSRLDPRLAEILVKYFSEHWQKLSPIQLQRLIQKQPWPGALGVLLEQTRHQISKEKRSLYEAWKTCATIEIKKAQYELYFFGLRSIGGVASLKDARYSHKDFLKWGYLSREVFVNKSAKNQITRMTALSRRQVLTELLHKKKRITVNDYISALDQNVSRRQAELDLKNFPRLRAEGQTRGRTYRKI